VKFDIFLCHNNKDKPVIEQLAHKFEASGFKVWLDTWNLLPSDPWQEKIEEALDNCQAYAVLVGPSGTGPWENENMGAAMEDRIKEDYLGEKKHYVIPVLLPGAPDHKTLKLPPFLTRLAWVDFHPGLDNENALYQLECSIKGLVLPPASHMPFDPNPLFTGRADALKKLDRAILHDAKTGTVITQAAAGMGGLGKTQLAIEFAYRHGKYFRGVHWLNLADASLFESEVANCGREMALPNFPALQPSQVTITLQAWKAGGLHLVILDNFEDMDRANDILPRLRHSNIRILATSHRSDWHPTMLHPILLDLFTPTESFEFLKRSLQNRKDNDNDLKALAEQLGNLPLGLQLASCYLNNHPDLKMTEYLAQAKEVLGYSTVTAWRKDVSGLTTMKHDIGLLGAFALSWYSMKNDIAKEVFQTAGYLAPHIPIPPEIFKGGLEISREECDEAVQTLYSLGLFEQSEDGSPSIHPMLAEFARILGKENKKILMALADILASLSFDMLTSGTPSDFNSINSHIALAASYVEQNYVKSVGNLLSNYGSHLWMIGDYSGARTAFEHALKIFEKQLGEDHPNVATLVNNLGMVLQALGDLPGARAAFERALKILEASLGRDHPNVVTLINNLGSVLQAMGDLPGARAAFERALKIGETSFGPYHPNIAETVNNLGDVLKAQGDLNSARAAYERAIKIWEVNLGTEHPHVATSVDSLGSVLKALDDLDGARTAFERALKIDEAAFGPDNTNVARDISNLGLVLHAQSDLPGARKAFERAIKIWEAAHGIEHPQVAHGLNNLGMVMKTLGDLPGARTAFERAIKIDEAALGPVHPDVAIGVNNLGGILQILGDWVGARAAYGRALKIFEKQLGENHLNVATLLGNLGGVLQELGDLGGARAAFERALRIFKRSLPPNHPSIRTLQENLDSLE
jgi:tetratricopeptide (TPR) repeat protein